MGRAYCHSQLSNLLIKYTRVIFLLASSVKEYDLSLSSEILIFHSALLMPVLDDHKY